MRSFLKNRFAAVALVLLALTQTAGASVLNDDLQNLVAEAGLLESELGTLELNAETVCAQLLHANQAARDMLSAVTAVDESLGAPLQVDAATFDALDALSQTSLALADEALRLSLDLGQLQDATSVLTLKDGITAMLQLSDDIGTMADRIGEMADRILVMADNIDVMADRIVTTQEIQSQNMTSSTQTLLQTQTNMLTLVSVVETQSRTLEFTALVEDGMELYWRMHAVMFSPWSMKYQLRDIAEEVREFLEQVTALNAALEGDAVQGTFYLNSGSLMQVYEVATMLTFIATAVDGYVVAIDGLSGSTPTLALRDSMKSMLQLSADIGTMADRIGEMADVILSMADNIGMAGDEIVATQRFQSANLTAVQESVLAAQLMVIAITVEEGL